MDRDPQTYKKFASMKCQRVKVDKPFVPALEDDATEVQHLLVEPKHDHVSACYGKENSSKHLQLEDSSCGFDHGPKRNCGGLDHIITQRQDELDLRVLDGLLDEVDEVDDFHAAYDISGACEDFLLDVELFNKISDLGFAPYGRSHFRNLSAESRSPRFSGSCTSNVPMWDSSAASVPESECKKGSLEKKLIKYQVNDSSDKKWEHQGLVGNGSFKASLDLGNVDGLDKAKPLESGISFDTIEKEAVQADEMSDLLGQKRLRKPTKRFIEELSAPKSKHMEEMDRTSPAAAKDKRLRIKSSEQFDCSRLLTEVRKEESLSETITQELLDDNERLSDLRSRCVTEKQKIASSSNSKLLDVGSRNEFSHMRGFKSTKRQVSLAVTNTREAVESRPRRGRPKNPSYVQVLESDVDYTASESEDETAKRRRSKKSGDRRKHQRMWTLSEVSRLIDGIAEHGTGRWTDIKKLFFSSSVYRTPIDLRDKWRNLLRAAAPHKQNKKEVEQKLKQNTRPLPKSVLRRIRELASLHPYPRFTPGGRYIRRKNN